MSVRYVFTVDYDADPRDHEDVRPIVWEQYLDNGAADLAPVMRKARELTRFGAYGVARVARLAYLDEPDHLQAAIDALRQWKAAQDVGDLDELRNARSARDAVLAAVDAAA